jgi:TATA-box binding protein (TBP) (component of TFIID and TFIIIB)
MAKVYRKLYKPTSLPDIKEFNENVASIKCEDEFASNLRISVFVVCASLNSLIDLKVLLDLYHEDNDGSFILKYNSKSKKSKKPKEKGEESFYNSLQIITKIKGNNISGKIFPNGNLQIAGCKSIEMCHNVPLLIKEFIYDYLPCIKTPSMYKLTNAKIGMINSQFKFGTDIDQNKLKDVINQNNWENSGNWRFATYQPSKYPGINAKYWSDSAVSTYKTWLANQLEKQKEAKENGVEFTMKNYPRKVQGQVAVFIFRSGNTIITGAKTIEDVRNAYNSLVKLVRDNPECSKERESDSDSSDSDSESDTDDSDFEY